MKLETSPPPVATGLCNGTAYSVYGAGEPLVLIHGVGMAQAVWAPQVAEFAGDHRVIVYDLLGHGASRLPDADVTLADYADQLAGLLDHLGIAGAAVVGHSMGALVALEFASRYPARVRKLAALNAVFRRTAEQRAAVQQRAETLHEVGVAATVDGTLERWFDQPVPAQLKASAALVRSLLTSVDPVGYARTYRLFASSDEVHAGALPRLTMPMLFMTGEFDPNSSPAMSAAMAKLAPQGELVVVEGERHMMTVTAPHKINRHLRAFLAAPAVLAAAATQRSV